MQCWCRSNAVSMTLEPEQALRRAVYAEVQGRCSLSERVMSSFLRESGCPWGDASACSAKDGAKPKKTCLLALCL